MLDNFTWNDDYSIAFEPTNDPRLVAVIQREIEAHAPDGDAYAPAAWPRRFGQFEPITSVYEDPDAFEAFHRAANRFGGRWDERVGRYLRIFHGVLQIEAVSSTVHRDYSVVILNTPAYRKHVGLPDDATDVLKGDVETWQAYLDGDVYGVGYAVNVGRIMDDGEPINIDDPEWDVTIECWGLYGDKYAKSEAKGFAYGRPDLPDMLPLPTED